MLMVLSHLTTPEKSVMMIGSGDTIPFIHIRLAIDVDSDWLLGGRNL